MKEKTATEAALATPLAGALQPRGPAEAKSAAVGFSAADVVPALVAQRESIASINNSPRLQAQRLQISDAGVAATDRGSLQSSPEDIAQLQPAGAATTTGIRE